MQCAWSHAVLLCEYLFSLRNLCSPLNYHSYNFAVFLCDHRPDRASADLQQSSHVNIMGIVECKGALRLIFQQISWR